MPTTQIQPLRSPDHGFGLLGRFAHAVTADYLSEAPPAPAFHAGYNTLPDPPFPLTAQVWHGIDTQAGWQACEQDLRLFLESGAASLRARPPADAGAYDEQTRAMQYLLRLDAMALAWRARHFSPTDSVAAWTLTADLLAGKAGPGDFSPEVAGESVIVWAVDRCGGSLLAWVPLGGTEDDIFVLAPGIDEHDTEAAEDDFAALLRQVLDAQCAWTLATFGADPPPHIAPVAASLRNL